MKSGGKVSWEVAISKIELGIYETFCLLGHAATYFNGHVLTFRWNLLSPSSG